MILLVEDDRKLGEMLCAFLSQAGLQVRWLRDGAEVAPFLQSSSPDLFILDWMLPNVTGVELCELIKQSSSAPVMMLTARQTVEDELQGLTVGADDYIRKPFDPDVLLARIHNLLKRSSTQQEQRRELILGELCLQHAAKLATLCGSALNISSTEFDLLWLLASHEGSVVSRDQVFMELRGIDYDGVDRLADVQVWRLRKKLDNHGLHNLEIRSVRGQGYVLCKLEGESS